MAPCVRVAIRPNRSNRPRVLQRSERPPRVLAHHVVRAERADTRLVHRKLDGGADDVRIGFVDGTPVVGKQQEPAIVTENRVGQWSIDQLRRHTERPSVVV